MRFVEKFLSYLWSSIINYFVLPVIYEKNILFCSIYISKSALFRAMWKERNLVMILLYFFPLFP